MNPPDAAQSTHTGLVREHNEDCVKTVPELGLYIVADGLGGLDRGEVASGIAVESVAREVGSGASLKDAVMQADTDICDTALATPGGSNMGTTMVAMVIAGREYRIAWVGDSRAYRINNGIEQLSHDHSLVQEMLDRGLIDAAGAREHPQRNVITKVLGGIRDSGKEVDEISGTLTDGDIFLLCSDGLHGLVEDADIEQAVQSAGSASEATQALVDLALKAGGLDNISVIIVNPK